jgi:S-adenosyl-L-methionine hydrolase (adenosine-forming)
VARPLISFLTDYGLRDPFVAICRGVIRSIAPEAEVLEISHEVTRFGVREGALTLAATVPWLPVAIHLAVVDPGVGTVRRPIGLRVPRGDVLVGPDNGLLLPAADRLGGVVEARALTERSLFVVDEISPSFHGRDVFAPVAARLASGTPFEKVGPTIEPKTLVRLPLPVAVVGAGELRTAVLLIDGFGNAALAGTAADLARALGSASPGDRVLVELRGTGDAPPIRIEVPWAQTFGAVPPGTPLLYIDADGRPCVAVNRASAAARLGLSEDDPVVLRRPR